MKFDDITAAVEWGWIAHKNGWTWQQTEEQLKLLVIDKPHRWEGGAVFCEICDRPNNDPIHGIERHGE